MKTLFFSLLFMSLFPLQAAAQTTGGVFGPNVSEDSEEIELRSTFDPDTDDLSQRLHYQKALNGDIRLRGVLQWDDPGDGDLEFDYFQIETLWQITPDGADWGSGLRFDARVRDGNRPAQLRINWINEFRLNDDWRVRALSLNTIQAGENANDGIGLETRFALKYDGFETIGTGLELFSSYGFTSDLRDFDDQSHQLGPYISIPIHEKWDIRLSSLFGLTDGSDDQNLRLDLTWDLSD